MVKNEKTMNYVLIAMGIVAVVLVSIASYFFIFHRDGNNAALNSIPGARNQEEQFDPNITDEQLRSYIRYPLPETASDSQKNDYRNMIAYYSQPGDLFVSQDCTTTPVIVRVKLGENLTVRNEDSVAHTLKFNNNKTVTVQPSSTTIMKVDFQEGYGGYGYNCDDKAELAGYVFTSARDE